jgi:diguanylate cyclase (GGDEF)-like protein
VVVAAVLLALFAVLTFGEISSEESAQSGLQSRFENRLLTASAFLSDYVASELKNEETLSKERLTSPNVTQAQFDSFAQDFNFGPSLLLDSRGRVLDVIPPEPSLLGVDIAPKYSHLMIAESGRENVSQVVSSAVQHIAVVAFAVPFNTPQGRRVMSGTLQISSGPLGHFLQSVHSIPGSAIFLADQHNRIIAASPKTTRSHLNATLTSLSANSHTHSAGHFAADVSIKGTPWKLLATLPTSELYRPIGGTSRAIQWSILLAFMVIALMLGVILLRGWERKLVQADEAGVDALTGLANRRQLEERTAVLYSASRRHHIGIAVMMIDIDHFKGVNDRFGHQTGDRVLQVVANCVRKCLRTEDVGARWGGEEFVIVLPFVSLAGAAQAAERLRSLIASTEIRVDREAVMSVTVSIGVAAEVDDVDPAELLALADIALYRAKDAGRNRVEQFVAPTSPAAR